MKTYPKLIATLFAATCFISVASYAADAEKSPATDAPAVKAKPHSHMQEKTGVPPSAKEAAPGEEKASAETKKPSKKRHYHPRDGK